MNFFFLAESCDKDGFRRQVHLQPNNKLIFNRLCTSLPTPGLQLVVNNRLQGVLLRNYMMVPQFHIADVH